GAAVQQCLQQNGVTDPRSATPDQRKAVHQCLQQNGFKRGQGNGPGPGVLGRVVHGDLIVRGKDGTFESVTYDRGKQDSHKGNTLTITRPDDKKVSVELTGDTKAANQTWPSTRTTPSFWSRFSPSTASVIMAPRMS